jgi:hypothetical protein
VGDCCRNPERSKGSPSQPRRFDGSVCESNLSRFGGVSELHLGERESPGEILSGAKDLCGVWRKRVRVERTDDIERCRPPVLKIT